MAKNAHLLFLVTIGLAIVISTSLLYTHYVDTYQPPFIVITGNPVAGSTTDDQARPTLQNRVPSFAKDKLAATRKNQALGEVAGLPTIIDDLYTKLAAIDTKLSAIQTRAGSGTPSPIPPPASTQPSQAICNNGVCEICQGTQCTPFDNPLTFCSIPTDCQTPAIKAKIASLQPPLNIFDTRIEWYAGAWLFGFRYDPQWHIPSMQAGEEIKECSFYPVNPSSGTTGEPRIEIPGFRRSDDGTENDKLTFTTTLNAEGRNVYTLSGGRKYIARDDKEFDERFLVTFNSRDPWIDIECIGASGTIYRKNKIVRYNWEPVNAAPTGYEGGYHPKCFGPRYEFDRTTGQCLV